MGNYIEKFDKKCNYVVKVTNQKHWAKIRQAMEEAGINPQSLKATELDSGEMFVGFYNGKFWKGTLAMVAHKRLRIVYYPKEKERSINMKDYPNLMARGITVNKIAEAMGYAHPDTLRRSILRHRIVGMLDKLIGTNEQ